jgi:uncharacterized membrane protein
VRKAIVFLLVLYGIGAAAAALVTALGGSVSPLVTIALTIVAFTFALLHGSEHMGWGRTLLLVASTFLISLLFESIGVATGLIYGPYHYTPRLGPQFLGLVPYLIPLAWFMMMYPSWVIADGIVSSGMKPVARGLAVAALGALVMTAWDVAMDPMMVTAGHWVWEVKGDYFGVPLQNYWGWWLTSFITLGAFIFLAKYIRGKPTAVQTRSFDQLAVYSYCITGLSSILTCLAIGLGGPALAGLFAMLPWVILSIRENV